MTSQADWVRRSAAPGFLRGRKFSELLKQQSSINALLMSRHVLSGYPPAPFADNSFLSVDEYEAVLAAVEAEIDRRCPL